MTGYSLRHVKHKANQRYVARRCCIHQTGVIQLLHTCKECIQIYNQPLPCKIGRSFQTRKFHVHSPARTAIHPGSTLKVLRWEFVTVLLNREADLVWPAISAAESVLAFSFIPLMRFPV